MSGRQLPGRAHADAEKSREDEIHAGQVKDHVPPVVRAAGGAFRQLLLQGLRQLPAGQGIQAARQADGQRCAVSIVLNFHQAVRSSCSSVGWRRFGYIYQTGITKTSA